MKATEVKFPGMRASLIQCLKDLADRKMQEKEWTSASANKLFWSNLISELHLLYDDFDLSENIEDKIGYFLRDTNEAVAITMLLGNIDTTLDNLGKDQKDDVYLSSPLWDQVVNATQYAHEIFMKDESMEALFEAERQRNLDQS